MTSRLLMPFRTADAGPAPDAETTGSTRPTPILDLAHPRVAALVTRVRRAADERGAVTDRARLRTAHGIIAAAVRPVYSVEDLRRVSRTLRLGRGSCSQRMAVLEAVARSLDVPTRVRGLLVDGAFWYPRFPRLRPFVPEEVLLAWPEFLLDGTWVPVAELFAGQDTGPAPAGGFTNTGPETLFEAVARTTVDWDAPAACAGSAPCDLSAHLRTDLGRFTSRDELFARHGQTLCLPARTLAEPVLGRWSAGAGSAAEDTPGGGRGPEPLSSSAA
ncbi:transglutaminase-like domain-containing protein [Streptomyces sp. NBC_00250]|uniref:transglutaminase domain-containing protein n=1 Tax=Streptomyces sp. NBC_00250 TaxID=2903641 RepID=UPI002E2DAD23|nr:transglutaminase domain-containing protein [Streptomyces sp. NBC_00250]